MSKRALITGITGQDGSYLAEHLIAQGYQVWGLIRGQANPRRWWVSRQLSEVNFVDGDLMDQSSLVSAVDKIQPDEVYNLGAISFVPMSWQQPELVTEVNGMGVLRMLEAIRMVSGLSISGITHNSGMRFYQASSSEMFGKVAETPQRETTMFHPRSPYGVAKAYGHYITQNYRESYGLFGVSGILFNHESPRRGAEFVTRKISLAVARIKLGHQDQLRLGNLDAVRDWGFAGDYVRAMHLMLQQEQGGDYVIGTGQMHSIRDAARIAFDHVDLNWEDYVVVDPALVRPAEVETLCADSRSARKALGWEPTIDFPDLMRMMVDSDLRNVSRERQYEEMLLSTSW
ncbi:GDP-mannose 4,6-dehydratase [Actinocrispum sp. NPDC049592]|uniref:GDP-mannose 4,6-dehydratase n=1 Tax=Actinocrispum sp. NPDC049592 TaxID=3154835 RepID=UPI0034402E0A